MRIQGQIVHKRPYQKSSKRNKYILILKVHEGVMVNGLIIHTIPVISSDEKINYRIGDYIDITGKIRYQRIVTTLGNLSFSPIPVMIPTDSR